MLGCSRAAMSKWQNPPEDGSGGVGRDGRSTGRKALSPNRPSLSPGKFSLAALERVTAGSWTGLRNLSDPADDGWLRGKSV